MKPKRGKYDTNPLDENVADRAEKSWGSSPTGPQTEPVSSQTREIGATQPIRGAESKPSGADSESEAPTRRIDQQPVTSYPSVFIPPKQPQANVYQPPRAAPPIYQAPPVPPTNIYQPPPVQPANLYQRPPQPMARGVAGLGISEKWANLLPYIPGHIGAVAAVVELLLVPRAETRARFHAAQGLALQLAILILTGMFEGVSLISGSSFGSGIFRAASTIFLIVSMVRVWKGKPHHITPLDEATNWFNEKINPRK